MNRERIFEFRDPESAVAKQRRLSRQVVEKSPEGLRLRFVCGLDAAYKGANGVGVVSVWDLQTLSMVEERYVISRVSVKYVPGFLGFREGPLIFSAAKKVESPVDVFLVDGHGMAHPRRFGLACHVGLALDWPTVGVAKSSLYGRVVDSQTVDKNGAVLGRVFKGEGARVLYVSVGHKIGLDDAFEVVRRSMVAGHPAPLRKAHLEAVRLRMELPG